MLCEGGEESGAFGNRTADGLSRRSVTVQRFADTVLCWARGNAIDVSV